jgi:hypothetical protein
MQRPGPSQQAFQKLGRAFNLLFMRATIYSVDHPSGMQAFWEFYRTVSEGLAIRSPLTLILDRGLFLVDEEPLDPRLNVSKMGAHFSRAGIQSLTFEKGLGENEIKGFISVFTNLNAYPTADSMKTALKEMGVINIKINHVVYRKMTSDDEIVSRDSLKNAATGGSSGKERLIDVVAEKLLPEGSAVEEFEKAPSLEDMLNGPTQFATGLIDADLTHFQKTHAQGAQRGTLLLQQLHTMKTRVESAEGDIKALSAVGLAEAGVGMRKALVEGMEAQRTAGVAFADEARIRKEADEFFEQVMINLVKTECEKGGVSLPGLAQLVRRIVPDGNELRQVLPKIKGVLLAKGMRISDFLQLILHIGRAAKSEELVQLLAKGATEIGLSSKDLIQEIKRDPTGAAELISLAAEIRKGTGDDKTLSKVLLEYIERVGYDTALDYAEGKGDEAGKHLKGVVARAETDLINGLRNTQVDGVVLSEVEESLKQRMEETLRQLKADLIVRQFPFLNPEEMSKATFLHALQKKVANEEELPRVLQQILLLLQERGVDENQLQQSYEEILERLSSQTKKAELKAPPKGTLNRGTLLFLLKKELARARRYDTPFSTITICIVKATPQTTVLPGTVTRNELRNEVITRLAKTVRETDYVGFFDDERFCAFLPMTAESGGTLAHRRILKTLQAEPIVVHDKPFEVKLAAVATSFHKDRTPSLQSFVKAIDMELNELMKPVKSWFRLDESKEEDKVRPQE